MRLRVQKIYEITFKKFFIEEYCYVVSIYGEISGILSTLWYVKFFITREFSVESCEAVLRGQDRVALKHIV